jgi:hypothetical protein
MQQAVGSELGKISSQGSTQTDDGLLYACHLSRPKLDSEKYSCYKGG